MPLMGIVLCIDFIMILPLNKNLSARVFQPVETTDPQYRIVDCGIQYSSGGIDSIAVGGSFHSLERAYQSWQDNCVNCADAEQVSDVAEAESVN